MSSREECVAKVEQTAATLSEHLGKVAVELRNLIEAACDLEMQDLPQYIERAKEATEDAARWLKDN